MKRYFAIALLIVAIVTLVVWAFTMLVQPILPAELNSALLLLVAALLSVIAVLAGYKEVVELVSHWRRQPIRPGPSSAPIAVEAGRAPSSLGDSVSALHTAEVSQRLRDVLEMINEGRLTDPFDQEKERRMYQEYYDADVAEPLDVRKLAVEIGLEKVSELEHYFNGSREPTFAFLDKFASTFGIDPRWLKFGEGRPFEASTQKASSPLGHYQFIVEVDPPQTIFVLSDSPTRQACIVLRLSKWRFLFLPGWLYISDASGGNSQLLFGFYKLARKFYEEWYANRYFECIIPHDKFERLLSHELYPGYLISPEVETSMWLSDFLDTERDWEESKQLLTSKYGYSLAVAQEVIRAYMRHQAPTDEVEAG
jgi:transcriptional regulator with XRE-family HTH domain